jgi:hypothetical protein
MARGGAVEKAQEHYQQATAPADELGMRPPVAYCPLGLGKLYQPTGTRQRVQRHLSIASTIFRAMDMGFWLEQAAEMGALG